MQKPLPLITVDGMAAALSTKQVRGHVKPGPARQLLEEHYDSLAPRLTGKPNWKALSVYLAGVGVVSRTGKPLQPAALRAAWQAVKTARGGAAKKAA